MHSGQLTCYSKYGHQMLTLLFTAWVDAVADCIIKFQDTETTEDKPDPKQNSKIWLLFIFLNSVKKNMPTSNFKITGIEENPHKFYKYLFLLGLSSSFFFFFFCEFGHLYGTI